MFWQLDTPSYPSLQSTRIKRCFQRPQYSKGVYLLYFCQVPMTKLSSPMREYNALAISREKSH